jgi:hypothetical protein
MPTIQIFSTKTRKTLKNEEKKLLTPMTPTLRENIRKKRPQKSWEIRNKLPASGSSLLKAPCYQYGKLPAF